MTSEIEEALNRLGKRVGTCSEEFLEQVDCCDALSLGGTSDKIRNKRKQLVKRIQVNNLNKNKADNPQLQKQ